MRKLFENWIFPVISFFMFVSLMILLLIDFPSGSISIKSFAAYTLSVFPYTLMLTGMFIVARPRFIEKHIGMPKMYEIHAIMTVVAFFTAFINIALFFRGFDQMFRNPATIFGYIGFLGIFCGMLTGMLSLSKMFIGKNKFLNKLKNEVLNREVMLWIHRISGIVAVFGVYAQQASLPFLRNNIPYFTLLTVYTVLIMGFYFVWKIRTTFDKRYRVTKIYQATPSLWVLEFAPINGKIKNYEPGEYFFIRFKKGKITREAHPFSTSSAITSTHKDSIEFMIKEAGDWTRSLANIKEGDIATLEGAYGEFYPHHVQETEDPFVLMGGGIGLTPNLSILRSEIDKKSQRKIILIWALSYKQDMFMLDELESYKKVNPNFEYHIIFSNEKVEGYEFGFISTDFLKKANVSEVFDNATFFICGPDIMMESTRKVLLSNKVNDSRIRVDDFGF